ncbi:MAG: hypothetical protein AB7P99_09015 [Vicinamibacterales bacterium]
MFVGHLAVALAAKPASPRVSLGILIGAAFGLDLLWPVLLLLGAEQVSVQPGITAFTPLNFERYPWSHSLLMAVVWGGILAILARPSQARARWVIGGLVSRSTTRRDGESRWALPQPVVLHHRHLGERPVLAATPRRNGDCNCRTRHVALSVVGPLDRAHAGRPPREVTRVNLAEEVERGPRDEPAYEA